MKVLVRVGVNVFVGVRVGVGVGVKVRVSVGVNVRVGEVVAVGVLVEVGIGDGVCVAVCVAGCVRLGDRVGVEVAVGVFVTDGVRVAVGVAGRVWLGDRVGVAAVHITGWYVSPSYTSTQVSLPSGTDPTTFVSPSKARDGGNPLLMMTVFAVPEFTSPSSEWSTTRKPCVPVTSTAAFPCTAISD